MIRALVLAAVLLGAGTTISLGQTVSPSGLPVGTFEPLEVPQTRDGAEPELRSPPAALTPEAPSTAIDLDFVLNEVRLVPADSSLAQLPSVLDEARREVGARSDLASLEGLRRRITEALVQEGYISSGARLREVDLAVGAATFEIIEGRLSDLTITGQVVPSEGREPGDLSAEYVRARAPDDDGPFNVREIEENLRILLRDRSIERIDAVVSSGDEPGDTRLGLNISTPRPYDLSLSVANDTADAIGEETVRLSFAARNILTSGDELRSEVEASEGRRRLILDADAPLWPGGISLFATAEFASSSFQQKPLSTLDVESDFLRFSGGVRIPLIETSHRRLTTVIGLDWKRTSSSLLGERFSFSDGVEDGVSKTAVLSAAQEFVELGEERTIALRLRANLGLPILRATTNSTNAPDGEFISLIGQAQVAQVLTREITLIGKLQGQWASGALLPVEQIAIGGRDTVRGFGEAIVSGDEAIVGSLEARARIGRLALPGVTPVAHDPVLTLAPFFDAGRVWREGDGRDTLIAAGAGLIWAPLPNVETSIYYGRALNGQRGSGLQGEGVHFAISIALP